MTEETVLCERCGLPKGRVGAEGPLWTPQVKGVEVCGCPPEDDLAQARATAIDKDLDALESELENLKKG